MKFFGIPSTELFESSRLDAYFHLSDGRRFARNAENGISAGRHSQLGSENGLNANIWAPARFKRVYAVQGEKELPYLRPSDTLNYVPRAADFLSATRSENVDDYRLREGMILVTCSGRNLGPVVYVDSFLAQFILSHDMVRVEIDDPELRFYVLGILGSPTGQHLLRKDKSGSVIDHITVDHVASLKIPMLSDSIAADISKQIKRVTQLREKARLGLATQQQTYEASLPKLPAAARLSTGWGISSKELFGRLDAAPYAPNVRAVRKALKAKGGGLLKEVATALKPTGRYKTIYVDRNNGLPILSGGQLLQTRPLNLRYMAPHALSGIDRYRLQRGWIAYQADGRSEEALGEPVMITPDREGWLASGHVGRIVANNPGDAGRLYLAFQTPHAQMQLKSFASGSVVDATFPADAENVILPALPSSGKEVEDCWEKFGEAQLLENSVFSTIEKNLSSVWDF